MGKIIVYGSQYGTTKSYADEISKRTAIKSVAYNDVSSLSAYETVLYLGGLYAGGVLGLSETIKRFPISPDQTFIIVTVGLADPRNQTNINNIRHSISNQIPEDLFINCKIFHIRGGIDYQKLNFKHKIMMKFLYNKTKNLPPE